MLNDVSQSHKLPNKKIRVYLGDRTPVIPGTFSYCTKTKDYKRLIPDFSFDKLDYAGYTNFTTFTNELTKLGQLPPESSKIGWSGNLFCHNNRLKLLELSRTHPEMLLVTHYSEHTVPEHYGINNNFISLQDIVKKSKYLIDLEGVGYSSRVKLLLYAQRPLFMQDRPWEEYYTPWLKPYEHYIPVKRDLSDLKSRYQWAETHEKECSDIAQNALKLAQTKLTYQDALNRLHGVLS